MDYKAEYRVVDVLGLFKLKSRIGQGVSLLNGELVNKLKRAKEVINLLSGKALPEILTRAWGESAL